MTSNTSVIIPCYNGEEFLPDALRSLKEQTALPQEIIVVDDGSTAPIKEPSDWNGPKLIIVRQSNKGIAAARNRGMQDACGKYIAFLDADDFWHPEKIALQEASLENNHAAVASYTRCVNAPGYFGFGPYPPEDISHDEFLIVLWYTSFFPPSAVMVRRSAIDVVGGFREGMGNGEDVELWLRLLALGQFVQVPLELCYYRQHAAQFTKNVIKKVLGGKDSRAAILQLHSDRIVQAGVKREKLWDPYRNDILLVYYRRQFRAARRLIWDYCKDHPRDFEMWMRWLISLLPAQLVSKWRGGIVDSSARTESTESDNVARWLQLVHGMSHILHSGVTQKRANEDEQHLTARAAGIEYP